MAVAVVAMVVVAAPNPMRFADVSGRLEVGTAVDPIPSLLPVDGVDALPPPAAAAAATARGDAQGVGTLLPDAGGVDSNLVVDTVGIVSRLLGAAALEGDAAGVDSLLVGDSAVVSSRPLDERRVEERRGEAVGVASLPLEALDQDPAPAAVRGDLGATVRGVDSAARGEDGAARGEDSAARGEDGAACGEDGAARGDFGAAAFVYGQMNHGRIRDVTAL